MGLGGLITWVSSSLPPLVMICLTRSGSVRTGSATRIRPDIKFPSGLTSNCEIPSAERRLSITATACFAAASRFGALCSTSSAKCQTRGFLKRKTKSATITTAAASTKIRPVPRNQGQSLRPPATAVTGRVLGNGGISGRKASLIVGAGKLSEKAYQSDWSHRPDRTAAPRHHKLDCKQDSVSWRDLANVALYRSCSGGFVDDPFRNRIDPRSHAKGDQEIL